jgi:ABC-type transport system involved in cytochrome bd biosynthesis fused ATPase/permease subunit
MWRSLLKILKERPIVSIIMCVALSEILQVVFSMFFDVSPTVYYGITVVAMLTLFILPVVLYMIEKKKNSKADDTDNDKLKE